MEALLWLVVTFAALWLLSFVLTQHIQGLILLLGGSTHIAVMIYDLLVLPGVVLRELSHMLVALGLGVRVLRVSLFQFRRLNDPRQGEVVIANTDPVRMSLIGAAPLLGGIAVLALLRPLLVSLLEGELLSFKQVGTLMGTPSALFALYLIVAVANTMFPSSADRQAWRVVFLVVLIMGLTIVSLHLTLPPSWIEAIFNAAKVLSNLLWPVLVIDLVVLVVVLLIEALVGRMRGRRIVYRSLS